MAAFKRCVGLALAMMVTVWLAACASPPPAPPADGETWVVVAVTDRPQPLPAVGATPHPAYVDAVGYAGSTQAAALAAELAERHRLQERAAWRIAPLQWRCMLFQLPAGADRAAVLAALNADPRVQLAQPLNRFETLTESPAGSAYNDPYVALQKGFQSIGAGAAQAWSQGEGVRVAVIDTGVAAGHPELAGRVRLQRDFVPGVAQAAAGEQHGTEVAGVIAAAANNRLGIVGVAPRVGLLAYRACWPVAGQAARCNSFTLAQALGAAIADGADVINLSLGGPADPLLARLVGYAQQRGAIVVGAVAPGAGLQGFPTGVPGVLAVAAEGGAVPAPALTAPGTGILTLEPGDGYGFASGSSLATAHVSGAVALLRALDPSLGAAALRTSLVAGPVDQRLDACAAVRRLRPQAACPSLTPLTATP